jgi:hypothetical protein
MWHVKPKLPCWFQAVVLPYFEEVDWHMHFRMSKQTFLQLERTLMPMLQPTLQQQRALSVGQQLATCLRFLATGAYYEVIARQMSSSKTAVHKCVRSVTTAMWELMAGQWIVFPSTPQELECNAAHAQHQVVCPPPSTPGPAGTDCCWIAAPDRARFEPPDGLAGAGAGCALGIATSFKR